MSDHIHISSAPTDDFEIVERKGKGHPDTICDEIADEVSVQLCKYYLSNLGSIQHHNVDKALLVSGISEPAFRGGKIVQPIELYIAGKAITEKEGHKIPVNEIVDRTAKTWIRENLRFVDVEKDVQVISKIRKGSKDLIELFQRFGEGEIPLANDTSIGTGSYPHTILERNVLDIEMLLNSKLTKQQFPFVGEDIKVMGVRNQKKTCYTIAIALIDRFVSDIEDYKSKIVAVRSFVSDELRIAGSKIEINTADNFEKQSIYLTVSGTSAENGDDGQIGRGNRLNGLITPYRPMSLEAVSGKNPVSHTGKIYNYFALDLCKSIYENHFSDEVTIFIVSQIGKPITHPLLLDIRLRKPHADNKRILEIVMEKLQGMPLLWQRMVKGERL